MGYSGVIVAQVAYISCIKYSFCALTFDIVVLRFSPTIVVVAVVVGGRDVSLPLSPSSGRRGQRRRQRRRRSMGAAADAARKAAEELDGQRHVGLDGQL